MTSAIAQRLDPPPPNAARRDRIRSLHELFSVQHGAASMAQLRALGFTRSAVNHLLDTGFMARAGPGVVIAVSSPDTWWRRARIATLINGVIAVSHRSAAELHGFDHDRAADDEHADPVEILVARGARPRVDDRVVIHFTRADPARITAERVIWIQSIPVLDLGTVLCQMAESISDASLRSMLVATLSTGPLSERRQRLAEINTAVRWWRYQGRSGPQLVAAALVGLGLAPP
jgi:hypothetical protein